MNSCIYNGEVTHTRFKPVKHFLKYKTFSILIDLDEIDILINQSNFFLITNLIFLVFMIRIMEKEMEVI